MPNLEPLPTLIFSFEEARKIEEYEDLTNEFNLLRLKVENKHEITEGDVIKFDKIIRIQWQRVLKSKSDETESGIKGRNTEGQNFAKNLKEIAKIRRKAEEYLEIDKYYELFNDLKEVHEDADAKISIEKHQKRESRKMLAIGFVLGVLGTLICSIVL